MSDLITIAFIAFAFVASACLIFLTVASVRKKDKDQRDGDKDLSAHIIDELKKRLGSEISEKISLQKELKSQELDSRFLEFRIKAGCRENQRLRKENENLHDLMVRYCSDLRKFGYFDKYIE